MLYSDGAGAPIPPRPKSESFFGRGATVLAGALLLAWPAVYNRYPLLFPDSITYLADGRPVARALFLHRFSDYYGMRSLLYSLGIFPFHWDVTPWPVVGLHALLAAYVLWLVIRSVSQRANAFRYLILAGLLGLLSSLSWFVSLVMPDVLGALAYLAMYLLVFARDTLSRSEHIAVAGVAWWTITSHITHLALAAGICLLLAGLLLLRCPPMKLRGKAVCEVAGIVCVAAASQLALHSYLYGRPSLNADPPPIVAARVIADGPGRWYLEKHCGEIELALCDSVRDLPDNTDDFLWNPDGIWPTAVREGDDRIREEEFAFVVAVVRAYPREQLSLSAANAWQQLAAFGLWGLERHDWVLEAFDTALPGDKPNYLKSGQFNDDLPLDFFSELQFWVVAASLGVLALGAMTPLMRREPSGRLLGLSVVILPAIVANAVVTGAFSGVEERYQSRVVWLLPFLAAILLLHWLDSRLHGAPQRELNSVRETANS